MNDEEIQKLFNRLTRLMESTQQKSGDGNAWDVTFANGETNHYIFRNIRSFDQVEDDVYNLLIWIWNAKDYLKLYAKTNGRDPKYVDRVVNNDSNLILCGDLANWIKHGQPKSSRSGKFVKLDRLKYTVTQSAIQSITFRSFEVDIDINNPSGVEFQMSILDKKDNEIGDVFECASAAIRKLELLKDEIESGNIIIR